jgi:hypothetical protein
MADTETYDPDYQEVPVELAGQEETSESISSQYLSDVSPDWQTDGMGLRGPQPDLPTAPPARPFDMTFEVQEGRASGGERLGGLTVTVEDASGYSAGSGVSEVTAVSTLTFDQANFEIFDGGGGQVVVKLKTCPSTCDSEL